MFVLFFYLLSIAFSLSAGQVFGLKAVNPNQPEIDGRHVFVYADSTLGLHDPFNNVPQFQGVLMPEYGIILQPDPCMVLKTSDRNIFTVGDSLYNPTVGFYEADNQLKPTEDHARFVICPTWNEVLLIDNGKVPVCDDAIEVQLELTSN